MDRDEAIRRIRTALHRRSGHTWSVTGGRGTAYGWIRIASPPARCIAGSIMPEEERAELGRLLGFAGPVHCQGESIPASTDYRRLYVHRAEHGNDGGLRATPYWD